MKKRKNNKLPFTNNTYFEYDVNDNCKRQSKGLDSGGVLQ